MPKLIFFQERREGFETESVTNTRATTKNDPFLNMGSNTGKSGCTQMGQNAIWGRRRTKNTRVLRR